jgi:hypothetical protein
MLGFPQRFTPPAAVRLLQRNYRSTQPLLAAANAVIAQAGQRFAKTLWSDKAVVAQAAAGARGRRGRPGALGGRRGAAPARGRHALTQQAVLFRTSTTARRWNWNWRAAHPLRQVRRPALPGSRAREGRGEPAALDAQPALPAGGLPGRAAGQRHRAGAALQLLDAMDASADPAQALLAWKPPPRAAARLGRRCATPARPLMRPTCPGRRAGPAIAWLQAQLPRLYGDDARVRSADLQQLARLAAGHRSRERFLTELTLDPPEASSDEAGPPHRDEDYLILSTIHSAKGQEWHAVHVLNVVDGCMPADLATGSAAEIDEERRLLYVAMTRARSGCTCCCRSVSTSRSSGAGAAGTCTRRARVPAADDPFHPGRMRQAWHGASQPRPNRCAARADAGDGAQPSIVACSAVNLNRQSAPGPKRAPPATVHPALALPGALHRQPSGTAAWACGPMPTPGGVPVLIRSPGYRVMKRLT